MLKEEDLPTGEPLADCHSCGTTITTWDYYVRLWVGPEASIAFCEDCDEDLFELVNEWEVIGEAGGCGFCGRDIDDLRHLVLDLVAGLGLSELGKSEDYRLCPRCDRVFSNFLDQLKEEKSE